MTALEMKGSGAWNFLSQKNGLCMTLLFEDQPRIFEEGGGGVFGTSEQRGHVQLKGETPWPVWRELEKTSQEDHSKPQFQFIFHLKKIVMTERNC